MNEKDKEKLRIEEEVFKTLSSIDDLEEIEPSPYFYTRLQANLNQPEEFSDSWYDLLLVKYKLVPSLLAVVLFLNIFTVFVMFSENEEIQRTTRADYLEVVAEEYLLTETSIAFDIVSE